MNDAAVPAPSEPPYRVRPAVPADVAFVVRTWLDHWKHESAWAHRVRTREFYAGHHPLIASILEHAAVLVACDAQDADSIAGFVVFEPSAAGGPVLDFVYVKKAMRQLGIGHALLAATALPAGLAGVRLSHCTRAWFTTKANGPGLEERFPLAIHHPYLAWRYAPRFNPGEQP